MDRNHNISGQMGILEQIARNERRLLTTSRALERLAGVGPQLDDTFLSCGSDRHSGQQHYVGKRLAVAHAGRFDFKAVGVQQC